MDNTEDMDSQCNQNGNSTWFIPENNKLDAYDFRDLIFKSLS